MRIRTVLVMIVVLAVGMTAPAIAMSPACHWRRVDTANPGPYGNVFTATAGSSATDVWGVGYYLDNQAVSRSMIQRWDGSAWSVTPHPDLGSESAFAGVVALAPDDAWAVGSYRVSIFEKRPLVEHWDGAAWSIVATPVVGDWAVLDGVAGNGSADVWAVGSFTVGGLLQTLAEHWDGSAWTVVPSPNRGDQGNSLASVALGSDDAWAIGSVVSPEGGTSRTLVEHWDGVAWTIAPSPNRGEFSGNYLHQAAAVGSDQVWSVGTAIPPGQDPLPLTIRWNGAQWRAVRTPPVGGASFNGLASVAETDVWVVGTSNGSSLAVHWDGGAWDVISVLTPGVSSAFRGAVAIAPGDVWAVGTFTDTDYIGRTLAEHLTC